MERKFFRKSVVVACTALIGTAFFTGCGDKKADSDYVFKIGTANGSLCLAPLHIADDNGYFEEEFKEAGIKYELVEIDMQQTADMIASKKIDACVGLVGSFIPQIDSGLDISFTTGLHTGCTKFYTSADSDINDMADLKGKKIGVPGMSDSSVVALKRILHDLGINVSRDNMEIELVVYNLTDLPLALANGAVDAVALHDPVAASAETEYGFKKLFDTTTDGKFSTEYCCAVFVTNDAVSEHSEAAAAYTRALMKASAYVQAEPENTAKLQIDNNQCSGELEDNAVLLASYNYKPSVSVMEDTFRNACSDLLEIGDLKEGRNIEEFTAEHVAQFDDVPDSYTYNNDGTFLEVGSKKK